MLEAGENQLIEKVDGYEQVRGPGIFLPTKWNNCPLWPETSGFTNPTM